MLAVFGRINPALRKFITLNMLRRILSASAGAMALSSAALAADLAPPPAYLPRAPIFTWTGLYLGGQIGYAWARQQTAVTTVVDFCPNVGAVVPFGFQPERRDRRRTHRL